MSLYTSNDVLIAQWCKSLEAWNGAFKQGKKGCIILTDGPGGEWKRAVG